MLELRLSTCTFKINALYSELEVESYSTEPEIIQGVLALSNGSKLECKKLTILLKILKSENFTRQSAHARMAIEYNCSQRLISSIVLGKALQKCPYVCNHDQFVHPNIVFLCIHQFGCTDLIG